MRIALLVTAVALLAPAPAQAAFHVFRSPSGKVGCAFYSDAETPASVRCDWRGADDQAMVLRETGRARLRHVTDTVMNPEAKVLRYGRSMTFRRLKCVSRRLGMTCRSLASGHGFRVSVEKQETF
jgi:eukaryotic-like serine/threonine-protein kinase